MKATFKTFESGAGDCIFFVLKDEQENSSYHIMVDCNVLTTEIMKFIRDDLSMRIDLLIITHIDSDHTNGITRLLRKKDFSKLKIKQIVFNCFQPQLAKPVALDNETIGKLNEVSSWLPPTLDEQSHKTNGIDAACFVAELNKHPDWKSVWRKILVKAGDTIKLGDNGKWGTLRFLSPSEEALKDLLRVVKLEYASKLGEAPPDQDFEDQDKYYELMIRMAALRKHPSKARKNGGTSITKGILEHFAQIDANENSVTEANKASLAFFWEDKKKTHRVLFMGDAVSSQVLEKLNEIDNATMHFDAVKVSHHGSKNNTSIALSKKVVSGNYFVTGGKKSEGPNLEAIAKIALNNASPKTIHFNHTDDIPLWDDLSKEDMMPLLNRFKLTLSKQNEHEFEC